MSTNTPTRTRKRAEETLNLNVWIPASLRLALDASAEKNRRSFTAEATIALEAYLETQGLWPIPNAEMNA